MVTDEDGRVLYNKSELEDIELKKSDDRDTALEKINQEPVLTQWQKVKKITGVFISTKVSGQFQVLSGDCCWKKFR